MVKHKIEAILSFLKALQENKGIDNEDLLFLIDDMEILDEDDKSFLKQEINLIESNS